MTKPAVIQFIESNFGAIDCDTLENAGYAFYQAAFASLFSAQWALTAGFGGIAGAIEATYALNGCNNPLQPIPDPEIGSGGWAGEYAESCECKTRVSIQIAPKDTEDWAESTFVGEYYGFKPGKAVFTVNVDTKIVTIDMSWTGYASASACNAGTGGDQIKQEDTFNPNADRDPQYRAFVQYIACDFPPNPIDPTPQPPEGPIGPERDFEDGECTWTISPVDAYVDNQGLVHTRYEVTPNDPACGKSFSYWSSTKGPDFVSPDAPNDPPGETQCEEPDLAGTKYLLKGICEDVAPGQSQPVFEWDISSGKASQVLAARLDSLALMLQTHLELKTPICEPEQPQPEGDFRTINFRSASPSPYSASRLRKRFRYRSTSGLGLGEIVDYWKDFSFESGSVVVSHVGSSWGTPKVFAASENEGKRVIRHAAGEAGIDPDQVGRWRIGSSNSSRLGVSDTMSVDTEGGFYRITSRDGSDGRPIVAL